MGEFDGGWVGLWMAFDGWVGNGGWVGGNNSGWVCRMRLLGLCFCFVFCFFFFFFLKIKDRLWILFWLWCSNGVGLILGVYVMF